MKKIWTHNIAIAALLSAACLAAASTASAADKRAHAPELDLSEMVELDAGTFTMGTSTDEEVGRYGDSWFVNEQPDHQVSVDGFYLDTFEVTVAEFALFLTYAGGDYHWHPDQQIEKVDAGYVAAEGADNEPARLLTWQAADHYCKWAGKRLPTEAEWEYAATGSENRTFPWGDDGGGCKVANYFAGSSFCEQGVLDVGSLADGKTPDGVSNMGGNVAEWVGDWYGNYADDGASQTDPQGPDSGKLRVVRGAGHLSSGRWRRSKARWGAEPKRRSQNIGFRCAHGAGSEKTGAVRGELAAPADENRQPSDRPLAPPAETPAVVAENLMNPGSVVAVMDSWYVLDRGAGSIVRIDPTDWAVESVLEGLDEPVEMVSDGASLFVADTGTGEISKIDPSDGTSTVLAENQVEPHSLEVNDQQAAWLSETTLRRFDLSRLGEAGYAVEDVLSDLVDPVALALNAETIYYSTRGNAAETTISYVDPTGSEGVQVLVDKDSIGLGDNMNRFYSQHVHVDAGGWIWFDLRYRGFPNNALVLCRIDLQDGSGSCPTFTPPPHDTRMTVVGKTAYLPVRNTVVRYTYEEDPTFYEITPWTRAGGILATEEFVVWTDEQNGRVYYQEVR
jgi:formylglycine-generating enzyme required for sulfatase activity